MNIQECVQNTICFEHAFALGMCGWSQSYPIPTATQHLDRRIAMTVTIASVHHPFCLNPPKSAPASLTCSGRCSAAVVAAAGAAAAEAAESAAAAAVIRPAAGRAAAAGGRSEPGSGAACPGPSRDCWCRTEEDRGVVTGRLQGWLAHQVQSCRPRQSWSLWERRGEGGGVLDSW